MTGTQHGAYNCVTFIIFNLYLHFICYVCVVSHRLANARIVLFLTHNTTESYNK